MHIAMDMCGFKDHKLACRDGTFQRAGQASRLRRYSAVDCAAFTLNERGATDIAFDPAIDM